MRGIDFSKVRRIPIRRRCFLAGFVILGREEITKSYISSGGAEVDTAEISRLD
jgi:hypothetical protein